MRQYVSATVTVFCRGCGNPRVLTRRQARRAGLCSDCLYMRETIKVEDKHRRWWFERFTDTELAVLASELAERVVPVARVTQRRAALTAAASVQGRKGVPSDGERAPHVLLSPPR